MTSHSVTHERLEHFKEQVIEAIPFHKARMDIHTKRFTTITALMPKALYKKLVRISAKTQGTPEYFVFDKHNTKYFFAMEDMDEEKKQWLNKTKKLVDTIVLRN
ncbi:hypothetical protein GOV09_03320 [Candidatus Woesearchaeota archaeon]|nr:hypothetical protein [Candidatus Woesearchaeota archaeon]